MCIRDRDYYFLYDKEYDKMSIYEFAIDSNFSGKFFFKQKTAYEILRSDWSSDVCSSDLYTPPVKPWKLGVPEVRDRKERPRAKPVTGAKS